MYPLKSSRSSPSLHQQAGFSLLEVLVAMTLFAITILGLLKYQQVLIAQFSYYADSQYAWRLAAQALEIYPTAIENEPRLDNDKWQLKIQAIPVESHCKKVIAQVITLNQIDVQLERWVCG
ncbi:MAG: prepilin-type N-terminal cleavage/methylation domain-containing protein [Enterobacteriaceae bacterium]|jgi:prepilin peptidase dependent protein C|nr:prepilin-type N-terminal cleavage/methylation domain-containing protein [Enterobacteriaceae bacterium]